MQRGKKYLIQVFNGLLTENEDEVDNFEVIEARWLTMKPVFYIKSTRRVQIFLDTIEVLEHKQ